MHAVVGRVHRRAGQSRHTDPDAVLTHLHSQRREPAAVEEVHPLLETHAPERLRGAVRIADPVLAGEVAAVPRVVLPVGIHRPHRRLHAVANHFQVVVAAARRIGHARDDRPELGQVAGVGLDLTRRGTAIAVRRVAVVALLGAFEHAVAAHRRSAGECGDVGRRATGHDIVALCAAIRPGDELVGRSVHHLWRHRADGID